MEANINYLTGDATLPKTQGNKIIVHMPRIGCGLAGGSWDRIEPLIVESLTVRGIETFVYDYP